MRQTVKISEDFDLEVKLGAGNELDTGVERFAEFQEHLERFAIQKYF